MLLFCAALRWAWLVDASLTGAAAEAEEAVAADEDGGACLETPALALL